MNRATTAIAALVALAAFAVPLTACGSDDPEASGPTPTTAAPPNEAVPDDEIVADGEAVRGEQVVPAGATTPAPLADADLMRVDVLDCEGSCRKEMTITPDGGYHIVYGTGEDKSGRLDPELFGTVRDAVVTTNFDDLRSEAAGTCDDPESFDVPVHYQVRNGDRVESITACGPAPAGSQLLAGMLVLSGEPALDD